MGRAKNVAMVENSAKIRRFNAVRSAMEAMICEIEQRNFDEVRYDNTTPILVTDGMMTTTRTTTTKAHPNAKTAATAATVLSTPPRKMPKQMSHEAAEAVASLLALSSPLRRPESSGRRRRDFLEDINNIDHLELNASSTSSPMATPSSPPSTVSEESGENTSADHSNLSYDASHAETNNCKDKNLEGNRVNDLCSRSRPSSPLNRQSDAIETERTRPEIQNNDKLRVNDASSSDKTCIIPESCNGDNNIISPSQRNPQQPGDSSTSKSTIRRALESTENLSSDFQKESSLVKNVPFDESSSFSDSGIKSTSKPLHLQNETNSNAPHPYLVGSKTRGGSQRDPNGASSLIDRKIQQQSTVEQNCEDDNNEKGENRFVDAPFLLCSDDSPDSPVDATEIISLKTAATLQKSNAEMKSVENTGNTSPKSSLKQSKKDAANVQSRSDKKDAVILGHLDPNVHQSAHILVKDQCSGNKFMEPATEDGNPSSVSPPIQPLSDALKTSAVNLPAEQQSHADEHNTASCVKDKEERVNNDSKWCHNESADVSNKSYDTTILKIDPTEQDLNANSDSNYDPKAITGNRSHDSSVYRLESRRHDTESQNYTTKTSAHNPVIRVDSDAERNKSDLNTEKKNHSLESDQSNRNNFMELSNNKYSLAVRITLPQSHDLGSLSEKFITEKQSYLNEHEAEGCVTEACHHDAESCRVDSATSSNQINDTNLETDPTKQNYDTEIPSHHRPKDTSSTGVLKVSVAELHFEARCISSQFGNTERSELASTKQENLDPEMQKYKVRMAKRQCSAIHFTKSSTKENHSSSTIPSFQLMADELPSSAVKFGTKRRLHDKKHKAGSEREGEQGSNNDPEPFYLESAKISNENDATTGEIATLMHDSDTKDASEHRTEESSDSCTLSTDKAEAYSTSNESQTETTDHSELDIHKSGDSSTKERSSGNNASCPSKEEEDSSSAIPIQPHSGELTPFATKPGTQQQLQFNEHEITRIVEEHQNGNIDTDLSRLKSGEIPNEANDTTTVEIAVSVKDSDTTVALGHHTEDSSDSALGNFSMDISQLDSAITESQSATTEAIAHRSASQDCLESDMQKSCSKSVKENSMCNTKKKQQKDDEDSGSTLQTTTSEGDELGSSAEMQATQRRSPSTEQTFCSRKSKKLFSSKKMVDQDIAQLRSCSKEVSDSNEMHESNGGVDFLKPVIHGTPKVVKHDSSEEYQPEDDEKSEAEDSFSPEFDEGTARQSLRQSREKNRDEESHCERRALRRHHRKPEFFSVPQDVPKRRRPRLKVDAITKSCHQDGNTTKPGAEDPHSTQGPESDDDRDHESTDPACERKSLRKRKPTDFFVQQPQEIRRRKRRFKTDVVAENSPPNEKSRKSSAVDQNSIHNSEAADNRDNPSADPGCQRKSQRKRKPTRFFDYEQDENPSTKRVKRRVNEVHSQEVEVDRSVSESFILGPEKELDKKAKLGEAPSAVNERKSSRKRKQTSFYAEESLTIPGSYDMKDELAPLPTAKWDPILQQVKVNAKETKGTETPKRLEAKLVTKQPAAQDNDSIELVNEQVTKSRAIPEASNDEIKPLKNKAPSREPNNENLEKRARHQLTTTRSASLGTSSSDLATRKSSRRLRTVASSTELEVLQLDNAVKKHTLLTKKDKNNPGKNEIQASVCKQEKTNLAAKQEKMNLAAKQEKTNPAAKQEKTNPAAKQDPTAKQGKTNATSNSVPKQLVQQQVASKRKSSSRTFQGGWRVIGDPFPAEPVRPGGFLVNFSFLLDKYDQLVAKGKFERVDFGPTLDSAKVAIDDKIEELEERREDGKESDPTVDEDIHDFKRGCRAFSAFEDQERLERAREKEEDANLERRRVYEARNYKKTEEDMEAENILSRPIQVSKGARCSRRASMRICPKTCRLCYGLVPEAQEAPKQLKMPLYRKFDIDLAEPDDEENQEESNTRRRRSRRAGHVSNKGPESYLALKDLKYKLAFVEEYYVDLTRVWLPLQHNAGGNDFK